MTCPGSQLGGGHRQDEVRGCFWLGCGASMVSAGPRFPFESGQRLPPRLKLWPVPSGVGRGGGQRQAEWSWRAGALKWPGGQAHGALPL